VGALKAMLDLFSSLTGLRINFSKSTIVPMHTMPSVVDTLQNIQGCQVGSFPKRIWDCRCHMRNSNYLLSPH
jgi:hypothetical protein